MPNENQVLLEILGEILITSPLPYRKLKNQHPSFPSSLFEGGRMLIYQDF
jgi:hypothetical protein